MRICFVSTAVAPADSGGIAQMISVSAEALARAGIETSVAHVTRAGSGAALRSGVDALDNRVRARSVAPVDDWHAAGFTCAQHAEAAAALEAVRLLHAAAPPDLIVAPESHAPAYVLLAARAADDPLLRETRIALRMFGGVQIVHRQDRVPLWQPDTIALWTMERAQFALADCVIVPGQGVLNVLRALYDERMPPVAVIPEVSRPLPVAAWVPRAPGAPLRLLYLGRLELMKGALDLAEALWSIGGEGWSLTLAGADTPTAPLGRSIKAEIECLFPSDPRIRVVGEIPHSQIPTLLSRHDVLVVPSTWETWSNALTEAQGAGMPALVTPVGCLPERMAGFGAGWVASGVGPAALADALRPLIDDPAIVDRHRAVLNVSPPDLGSPTFVDLHVQLARPVLAASHEPMVAAPLCALVLAEEGTGTDLVARSLDSLSVQRRPVTETVVVGHRLPKAVRAAAAERGIRCVDVPRPSRAHACMVGAQQTDGHLLILPAGVSLDALFTKRAGAVLDRDQSVGWVGCWIAGRRPVRSLGANPDYACECNLLGCFPAILRRSVVQSYGFDARHDPVVEWHLFRRLARDGIRGLIIPEDLARAEVNDDPFCRLPDYLQRLAIAQMDVAVAAETIPWSATLQCLSDDRR